MEIKLDSIVSPELKEYLLKQEGINNVEINYDEEFIKITVKSNDKTSPNIIMKHIEFFQENKFSELVSFKKDFEGPTKTLIYKVDDLCCEYCFMGFIRDLFENNQIIGIESNFDTYKPAMNLEFIIEYDEDYHEQELINFIKNKLGVFEGEV